MTAAQCGGSALEILLTTVVLPEPVPPAIPMMVISFFRYIVITLYRTLFLFLNQVDHCRQVVAIAVEPDTTGMGTQGVALILALFLEEIVA